MNKGQTSFLSTLTPPRYGSISNNSRCLVLLDRLNPGYLATLEVGPFLNLNGTSYFNEKFCTTKNELQRILGPASEIGVDKDKVQNQWAMRYQKHDLGDQGLCTRTGGVTLDSILSECNRLYGLYESQYVDCEEHQLGAPQVYNMDAAKFGHYLCVSLYDWKESYPIGLNETIYWNFGGSAETQKEKTAEIRMVLSSLLYGDDTEGSRVRWDGAEGSIPLFRQIYAKEVYSFNVENENKKGESAWRRNG